MATKKTQAASDGVLISAARSIGSAFGEITAKAEELTTAAKKSVQSIHMPSLPTASEAKKMVTGLLPGKKKKAAVKKKVKADVKKVEKKAVKAEKKVVKVAAKAKAAVKAKVAPKIAPKKPAPKKK